MIRAFLLATATVARLNPRRSRSWLIHSLLGSVLLGAVRTTARARAGERGADELSASIGVEYLRLSVSNQCLLNAIDAVDRVRQGECRLFRKRLFQQARRTQSSGLGSPWPRGRRGLPASERRPLERLRKSRRVWMLRLGFVFRRATVRKA